MTKGLSDDRYMNGDGIMRRTRELNDEMWATIDGVILGDTLAFAGPVVSAVAWGVAFSASGWSLFIFYMLVLACAVAGACVAVGIVMGSPYRKARAAVEEHRRAMKAETTKRGPGWART